MRHNDVVSSYTISTGFPRLMNDQRTPTFWGVTQVVVPQSTDLREEILKEFQCSHFVMHLSGTKIYHDLRRQYY